MNEPFKLPRAEIEAFCRKWKIERLELFGSAVRGELTPESDVDFLVTWSADRHWPWMDDSEPRKELEALLGRRVDLVSRPSIERSRNWVLRQHVLSSTRLVYAA